MKHTSKLAYLLGLPVLVGLSALCVVNVVNGDVSIRVPTLGNLHRSQLYSLFLGKSDTGANINLNVDRDRLNISNGLIMGQNNDAGESARYVSIGGGLNNYIASVEKSGIGGGSENKINSSYSVIGGGKSNVISGDDSGVSAIAGGLSNITYSGGTIVGGKLNQVNGTGVIVGGKNNKINGDGSIAFGTNSQGKVGTFSWNGVASDDFSAIITANGGTLIGTYEPVAGVNLVVDGAVKIGTNEIPGIGGEIRIQSGCFCGYAGNGRWYTINKGLENQCDCFSTGCTLIVGGEEIPYLPGDSVEMFSEIVGVECHKVILVCRGDGVFGCKGATCSGDTTLHGAEYVPTCTIVGEPKCGTANGKPRTTPPSTNKQRCIVGTPSHYRSSKTGYTWTCEHNNESVDCAATKIYECEGIGPSQWGAIIGPDTYEFGNAPNIEWTYIEPEQTPGACQWTCKSGYHSVIEEDGAIGCEMNYFCITPATGMMMFDNSNIEHVKKINSAAASGQVKKLYRTEAEAKENPCSYICTNGYEFLPADPDLGKPDRCAICTEGTKQWTGENDEILWRCIEKIDYMCKNDDYYAYNREEDKCVAYGHCLSDENAYDVVPPNSNIGELADVRPISGDKVWTYVNSLEDYHANSCEYYCDTGYRHVPGDIGCADVSCITESDTAGYSPVLYKGGKFTSGVFINPIERNTSWTYFVSSSGVTSDADFQQQVANRFGCFFWCPEENLCKLKQNRCGETSKQNLWKCYSSPNERNANCKMATNCGGGGGGEDHGECLFPPGRSLKGYARYNADESPTSENTGFLYSTGLNGYAERGGLCVEGCTSEATKVYLGTDKGDICWKQCGANEYFNYNRNLDNNRSVKQQGGCRKCSSNLMKPNTGDMFLDNPASCTSICEPGYTAVMNNQVFAGCIPTVVDAQGCPVGYTYDNASGLCRRDYDDLYKDGQCPAGLIPIINGGIARCGCANPEFKVIETEEGVYSCGCPQGYVESPEGGSCQAVNNGDNNESGSSNNNVIDEEDSNDENAEEVWL